MIMVRPVAALVFLTITLSVFATSWQDNSHYVALGPRTGYYIVRPGSAISSAFTTLLRAIRPIHLTTGREPMRLPSALIAPASYLRLLLISCKRYRTNSTLSGSVRLFAVRANWQT
jgi:hypothetical protein